MTDIVERLDCRDLSKPSPVRDLYLHGQDPDAYPLSSEAIEALLALTNEAASTITALREEVERMARKAYEAEGRLAVLIDAGLTKEACYQMIRDAGIDLPRVYAQGYPNANCIGCVKATSPTYWNHVRQQHPNVFEARAEQSRRLGAKLVRVNNQRIFLDELDPSATGKPLKSMKAVECGIFCEERP